MIGQLLSGRYRISQVLAQGGMSQTYVAQDTQRPGKPRCVVKVLKPTFRNEQELAIARRLFNTEAEILEQLGDHEQIPRLLAYCEENQQFYLVQEYIEGYLLDKEMPLGQCWSELQVIQLMQEVLHILEFVHSQGVIHRDIKPKNLMRRRDGKLALIDFGSVKQVQLQQLAMMGEVTLTVAIGTPGYVAPESACGKPRFNSDLYSLGMTCIQALTGISPSKLQSDNLGEVVWRNRAQVSDGLAAILTKMVQTYFTNRYQTASEVLQDLTYLSQSWQWPSEAAVPAAVFNPTAPQSRSAPANRSSPTSNQTPVRSQAVQPVKQGIRFSWERPIPPPPVLPTNMRTWAPLLLLGLLVGIGYRELQGRLGTQALLSPASQQEEQSRLQPLIEAEDYASCVRTIQQEYSTRPSDTIQTLLGQCQLGQAQQLAEQGHYQDAIAIANQVPPNTDFSREAQNEVEHWSERILELAEEQYQAGKLNEALAMVAAVPPNTPLREQGQEQAGQWQEEWDANNSALEASEQALTAGDWQTALDEANQLTTDYWQDRAAPTISTAQERLATAAIPTATPTPNPTPTPAPQTPEPSDTPAANTAPPPTAALPSPTPNANPAPEVATPPGTNTNQSNYHAFFLKVDCPAMAANPSIYITAEFIPSNSNSFVTKEYEIAASQEPKFLFTTGNQFVYISARSANGNYVWGRQEVVLGTIAGQSIYHTLSCYG
jgi:serine/threonine-protein kinase